jgi:hypothetical protein
MLQVWNTKHFLNPKLVIVVVLVMLSTTLPACNRSSSEAIPSETVAPTPTPTPVNPQALLQESGRIMSELEAFYFSLEHEDGEGTPLAENFFLVRAEGKVIKPDRISVDFSASAGGFAIKSSLISIGSTSYMTNPLNGEWSEVSQEVSPLAFFSPQTGISSIMLQVEQPVLMSSNDRTYTLQGLIPAEALAPLFGVTVQGELVNVELVLDINDLHLLRATLDGKITPFEEDGVVRVIRLSDFNEPLVISAPEIE